MVPGGDGIDPDRGELDRQTGGDGIDGGVGGGDSSMPGAGFSAVAPDMNRNDPPGATFPAKCLASSRGPVTFVPNEAFTTFAVRSR